MQIADCRTQNKRHNGQNSARRTRRFAVYSAFCRSTSLAALSLSKGNLQSAICVGLLLAALGCDRSSPTPSPGSAGRPQRLPTAAIRIGDIPLVVEVADTPAEHHKGMMFRPRLEPDEAMLFVFPRDDNLSFWMKNTYVDLDLAFIASDGVIVQIERLEAFDAEPVYSRRPARFALELPAGWLAAHGIGLGAHVTIPPEVTETEMTPPSPDG